MHIAEKYASLARDSHSSGDSVAAENYLQHAEHYNRIILAAQAAMPPMDQPGGMNGGGRFNQESFHRDHDDSDEEESGEDFVTQPPPRFLERPVYNQNQPQPFIPQNAFPHVQPQLQPAAPAQNGPCAIRGRELRLCARRGWAKAPPPGVLLATIQESPSMQSRAAKGRRRRMVPLEAIQCRMRQRRSN